MILFAGVLSLPARAEFSNFADDTWMTNGFVRSIAKLGNTIYIGGKFTSVRACPAGTACGPAIAVKNVAAFDATTGNAIASFSPEVTGGTDVTVFALAVLNGRLFIGGRFTAVDGTARRNFAAVDAATGDLVGEVDASIGTEPAHFVKALLAAGDRIYVGGVFNGVVDGINTYSRIRLAAFDSAGTLDPKWRPRADATVSSLAVSCDGLSVFAGGKFNRASGTASPFQARRSLAQFDRVNGALLPFQIQPGEIANDLHAYDLAPTCNEIFVAYAGSNWAYSIDLTTGLANWGLKTAGDVQTVAIYGSRVLFGGHFGQIDATNQNNAKRTRFAVVNFEGEIDPWAPTFEGRFLGPWDILVDGNHVWVGGDFTTVSGVGQRGIARFTDTP
jgi:hypothetical protein